MIFRQGPMIFRLAIRGFADGRLLFEERVEIAETDIEKVPALAEKHATILAEHRRHMLEIEFLDEPDPLTRFYRIGTDPSGMTMPKLRRLR